MFSNTLSSVWGFAEHQTAKQTYLESLFSGNTFCSAFFAAFGEGFDEA